METKDYRILFIEKEVLGRKADLTKPEEVICKCINLAYRDMLTAGRYYLRNTTENNTKSRCSKFKRILENNNYIYSRNIIEETLFLFGTEEEIGSNNKYVTRYGLAQKLVNMTYKYFYVFKDDIKKDIDFSSCDCPLDRVVLKEKLDLKGYTWSKLTKEEYEYCQQVIMERLPKDLDTELKLLGNLAYDFLNW